MIYVQWRPKGLSGFLKWAIFENRYCWLRSGYSDSHVQKQPPEVLCKKGVLKNFAKVFSNKNKNKNHYQNVPGNSSNFSEQLLCQMLAIWYFCLMDLASVAFYHPQEWKNSRFDINSYIQQANVSHFHLFCNTSIRECVSLFYSKY